MDLFLGAVVSGITVGVLYGLLAFPVVLLFKSTGVANFAVGNTATFLTFVVFVAMRDTGLGVWAATGAGLLVAAALGLAMYLLGLRVNDHTADHANLLMRTLALYLLLVAFIRVHWSEGEPFAFPALFPGRSVQAGAVSVSYQSLGALAVSAVLALAFWAFFTRTRLGLLFLATAERPDIARLLGVDTRRLSALAWAGTAVVALIVGVLVAPANLLSADMMELFLLYAFTSAIVGGLTSLPGVFVGGTCVGVLSNVTSVYLGRDPSVFAVFGLLLLVLLARPSGLFGDRGLDRV